MFLQIPGIQTYLVSKVTTEISEVTGHATSIDYVNVSWFDEAYVQGIKVYDKADSLMFEADELTLNFDLLEIVRSRRIRLDRVEIKTGNFHLMKHSDQNPLNLTQFLDEIRSLLASDTDEKKEKKPITVGEIDMWNSVFRIDDFRKPTQPVGIDFNHFALEKINLSINDFRLIYDSIDFHITSFTAKETDENIVLRKFNSDFALTSGSLTFSELYAETDNSVIREFLDFRFSTISNMSYFIDSVNFEMDFKNSTIHTDDLSQFATSLKPYQQSINISGIYSGSVKNFQGENMELKFGDNSKMKGQCFISGLPNIDETFMEFKVDNTLVYPQDFAFLTNLDSIPFLQNLDKIRMDGTFLGFLTDFVAKANFVTAAGSFTTDLNFKLKDDPSKSEYRGELSVRDFDIGKIVGPDQVLDQLTMSGKIEGTGITPESANFELEAQLDEFKVNNYTYTNIYTDGHFESEFFKGRLVIDDPNVSLDLDGTIDIRQGKEKVEGIAELHHVNLDDLGLLKTDLSLNSKVDISIDGSTIDEIAGYVNLSQFKVEHNEKDLTIDSLKISSLKVGDNRLLTIETEELRGEINGTFRTTELISDIYRQYREFVLQLENDESEISQYYADLEIDASSYKAEFDLELEDVNSLINPFVEQFYISPGVNISGGFLKNVTSNFSLYGKIDSIHYDGTSLKSSIVELNTSKEQTSKDALAMLYFFSQNFSYNELQTENLELETIWNQNVLDAYFNVRQLETKNKASLQAKVEFLNDTTDISIAKSNVVLENSSWELSENNLVRLTKNKVLVSDFLVESGSESIKIDGYLSDTSNLDFTIRDFNLNSLSSLLNENIAGLSNGELSFHGPVSDLFATGIFEIDSLLISDFLVGDLSLITEWNDFTKELDLQSSISRGDDKIVDIKGDITLESDLKELELEAKLSKADLKIVEPFLKDYISNLSGTASGNYLIKGTTTDPLIYGNGILEDGFVTLNYLKTRYGFNGKYNLNKHEITLDGVELKDLNNNNAYFSGKILHNGFRDIRLDLNGDLFNFNMLNTRSQDNSLYYGQANVTGNVKFQGPLSNLKIVAKAKTDNGSKLYVPLSDNSSADLKDYISFIDLSDTIENQQNVIERYSADLRGIELDLELEVTEDAYFELIFDLKAGDIIRGRGNGNLKIQINTEGDFNMVGDYVFTQGGYNFTLYNIINKEFAIRKGSKISWYGDPYKAVLDITADYRQNILYSPIFTGLSDEAASDPQLRRRYPASVVLNLSDEMLNPVIDFDIEFDNYPQQTVRLNDGTSLNYASFIEPFLFKIQNDEQELKRQVFSLLILRKLSPENSFDVAGQTIGSSVSEFISNQLSYWISQVDENLEIDVDLSTLDEDALETFQLRLSYTFLNGRLRVSRLGGITNYTSSTTANTAGFSNIIGDISVEYLLTPDGRLRAKMYSRNQNDDQLEQGLETGVSLQYVRTFDFLQEIWKKNRAKKTRFVDADGNVVEVSTDKKRNKKKSEK